jgi:hypothetical protein
MAGITSTSDDHHAAGHYSGTYNHKYDDAITEEPAAAADNHSGIVAGQTTEKTDEGLSKQYGDPALDESGMYSTSTAQNKYAGAILKPGIGNDDDDDQSGGGGGGHTTEKIQKQYGEPVKKNPALEESGNVSGIAQNKYEGATITQEVAAAADDHLGGGGFQEDKHSDEDLSVTDEIDPEDEDSDDPEDPQTKVEKKKYDNNARRDYLLTLQSATQKS